MGDAFTRTDLADIYAYFTGFGPSGRWGLVYEEAFAVLAGDEPFIEACAAAAGGRAVLRQHFLRWSDTEWLGSGLHLRQVLERVGW